MSNTFKTRTLEGSTPMLETYRRLIAHGHFTGRWRECPSPACKKRKRCTGGPRRQFTIVGRPVCFKGDDLPDYPLKGRAALEANAALALARAEEEAIARRWKIARGESVKSSDIIDAGRDDCEATGNWPNSGSVPGAATPYIDK